MKKLSVVSSMAPSYLPGLRIAERLLRENGFEKSAKVVDFQIRVLEANPAADTPPSATLALEWRPITQLPEGARVRMLADGETHVSRRDPDTGEHLALEVPMIRRADGTTAKLDI